MDNIVKIKAMYIKNMLKDLVIKPKLIPVEEYNSGIISKEKYNEKDDNKNNC